MLRALADPETRKKLTDAGFDVVGSTPGEFLTFVRTGYGKLGRIIRDYSIKVD